VTDSSFCFEFTSRRHWTI